MTGFKFLEHTADIFIEATGSSLEEAFIQAAYGVFETMTDLRTIASVEKREIHIQGEDLKALLFEWINQFLYLFDVEGLVFSKFEVEINEIENEYILAAQCWGEPFDREKHPPRTEIKAPTYNQMEIVQKESEVTRRFVVDI